MNRKGLKNSLLFLMIWPIVVELIVNGLIANVNQVIINKFSTDAVAAIGNAAQIPTVILNIYGIISIGVSIILAQIVGAKRYEECNNIINTALSIIFLFGLFLSCVGVFCIPWMIKAIHIPDGLICLSKQYLLISIGFSFVQAILNTLTVIFRSLGYMKKVMITSISVNLICLLLNKLISICIPIENQSLMQYALTGTIAQFAGIIIFFSMLIRDKKINYRYSVHDVLSNSKRYVRRILRIGVPGGLEGIIYLLSQTVVIGFIGVLGTQVMFTKAIVGNVTYYMSMATSTISTAAGVLIGQLIGAGKTEEVKKTCKRNIILSLIITIPICVILMIFGQDILTIYTDKIEIIDIGMRVLLCNCILEAARCVAAIMIISLKAVGDVDFPFAIVIIGSISNIAISYYFGIYMNLGLEGIWIGYIADLVIRGAACIIHWKREKWIKYSVGHN